MIDRAAALKIALISMAWREGDAVNTNLFGMASRLGEEGEKAHALGDVMGKLPRAANDW